MSLRMVRPSIVLAFAFVLVGSARSVKAQENACNNATTTPRVVSGILVSPENLDVIRNPVIWNPARGRLTRGEINYVSGDSIRLNIVTDKCTYIKYVHLGAQKLAPEVYNSGGYWFSASPAPQQPQDSSQFAHSVSALFLNPKDGGSEQLTVTVGRTGGVATASYSLRLARVLSIEKEFTIGQFGASGAEMHNIIAKGVREGFGSRSEKSVAGITFYYDAATFSSSVTSAGTSFGFHVNVDKPCVSFINVSGSFDLVKGSPADPRALVVQWGNPLSVRPQYSGVCAIAIPALGPIEATVTDMIIRAVVGTQTGGVNDTINGALQETLAPLGAAARLITSSTARKDELAVNAAITFPSVTIQVPYVSVEEKGVGVAVEKGETIVLAASGLGMNDAAYNAGTSVSSGPNGVPLAGTVNFPAARVVTRTSGLPYAPTRPGQLVMRPQLSGGAAEVMSVNTTLTTHAYSPGCALKAMVGRGPAMGSPTKAEIRFAVNDSVADSRRLRDHGAAGYKVRMYFVRDTVLDLKACTVIPSSSSSLTVADPRGMPPRIGNRPGELTPAGSSPRGAPH